MSQKKKLVLSPLPEQTDDYSRYEESETRWDRIITVLVIIALFTGIFYYLMVGDDEGVYVKSLISPLSEDINTPSIQNATNVGNAVVQEVEQEIDSGSKVNTAEQAVLSDTKVNEVPPIEKSVEQEEKQSITKDASEKPEAIVKNAPVNEVTKAPRKADVNIENKAITRAVLTLGIKDKQPLSAIPYELTLPDEGITKVILFTEIKGLRGKDLYHEWYRNGVRQARVRIPVNITEQSSYSSKYINTQMLGDWQVKVVDGKSKSYVTAEFKVVLP